MSTGFQVIICFLFIGLIISLWVISYYIFSLNEDFNKFRKDFKNMFYKNDEKRIYGHPICYWRRLYEYEFGRDTSLESDKEFLENHKAWIKNNKDESRHCF